MAIRTRNEEGQLFLTRRPSCVRARVTLAQPSYILALERRTSVQGAALLRALVVAMIPPRIIIRSKVVHAPTTLGKSIGIEIRRASKDRLVWSGRWSSRRSRSRRQRPISSIHPRNVAPDARIVIPIPLRPLHILNLLPLIVFKLLQPNLVLCRPIRRFAKTRVGRPLVSSTKAKSFGTDKGQEREPSKRSRCLALRRLDGVLPNEISMPKRRPRRGLAFNVFGDAKLANTFASSRDASFDTPGPFAHRYAFLRGLTRSSSLLEPPIEEEPTHAKERDANGGENAESEHNLSEYAHRLASRIWTISWLVSGSVGREVVQSDVFKLGDGEVDVGERDETKARCRGAAVGSSTCGWSCLRCSSEGVDGVYVAEVGDTEDDIGWRVHIPKKRVCLK